jgi:hypothetical protein
MIKFAASFAILTFISALCIAANAQNAWVGAYEFDEDGGKNAGGTAIFINHQLEVRETAGGALMATLQSNGYQTSKDLICTAKTEGNKLLIYFESYGENNVLETFEQGDLLLALKKKTAKGKTQILTFWSKFQPVVPKNEKSGKVYFRKIQ